MGGGANQQQTPWVVLLCKLLDTQSDPPDMRPDFFSLCRKFFTTDGAGTFNAVQFFQDMSHGSLDLSASQVDGWITLNAFLSDLLPCNSPEDCSNRRNNMMQMAKQAARQAGIPLDGYYGIVLVFNVAVGGSQGGKWPGGAPDPGVFSDYRYVQGNGTEAYGQEMGHGYGLGHSRRDGFNVDYLDPWDVMSTPNAYSAFDPNYTLKGPGINAWNMRGRGWLDESRVYRGPGITFDRIVQLRPLHRRDLPGLLAAELPPNVGAGGYGRYLVEFRIKDGGWDAAIPRSAILVHRFEGVIGQFLGDHSYIMSDTKGNQDLVEGDVFAPSVNGGARVKVLQIDENRQTATVQLAYLPAFAMTIVGPTHIDVFEGEVQDDPQVQGNYSVNGISGASGITWTGGPGVQVSPSNQQTTIALFDMTGHTDAGSSHVFTINVNVFDSFGIAVSVQETVSIFVKPNK
jgi:hypothetical protein